jgi:F-box and WD-40 domain protein CDC4
MLTKWAAGQTVSIGWEEEQEVSSIQIGVAECVETKTVTTTTTTKRSYPPLIVRQQPLASLDAKEYPLALRETPAELANFSFELDGRLVDFENGCNEVRYKTPETSKSERGTDDLLNKKQSSIDHKRRIQGLSRKPPKSSGGGKARKLHINPDLVRSGNGESSRRQIRMRLEDNSGFPATPDLSELESANEQNRKFGSYFEDNYTPQSGMSQTDSFDDTESQTDLFPSAVATPPIAESDLEPLDATDETYAYPGRPTINTQVAQNASLPSPGLSPTYQGDHFDDVEDDSPITQSGDSQDTINSDCLLRGLNE